MANKNVLESYMRDYLERCLRLKFDICTCKLCREKMMEHLLAKIPEVYANPKDPLYKHYETKAISDHLKFIFEQTTNAIHLVEINPPHSLDSNRVQAFKDLLAKIKEVRGVDFSQYNKTILKRRIALRLLSNMVTSYTEYLKVLAQNPAEYDKLFDALTINVSEFFRDPEVWLEVGHLVKTIVEIANRKKKPVVLWSAACAGGEEPYSLAILTQFLNNIHCSLKIYASDVDKPILEKAKIGRYKSDVIAKASSNAKKFGELDIYSYLVSKPEGYHVRDFIKELVEFRYLDLTSTDYIEEVDMILCRNAFIYFTKPLQEQILDKFYRSLKNGGYLVIGKTESLVSEARYIFKELNVVNKIYQKISV